MVILSVLYIWISQKALDTINHDLLLAKFKVNGFSKDVLNLLCSYLKKCKQRVEINNSASTTKIVVAGVPQGHIDGPLLFNIFVNDLALFILYIYLYNTRQLRWWQE